MIRFSDWQSRLEKFLRANRDTPFEWGKWDCCLWVGSAIEAMTGVDIASEWRGAYSSAGGAAKVMLSVGAPGVTEMAEFVAMKNRMAEVRPTMAQRGDMVALKNPVTGEICLGLVSLNGHQVMVVPDSGFAFVGIEAIERAWRVG